MSTAFVIEQPTKYKVESENSEIGSREIGSREIGSQVAEPREQLLQALASSSVLTWLSDGTSLASTRILLRLAPVLFVLATIWLTLRFELQASMQHELESLYAVVLLIASAYTVFLCAFKVGSSSLAAVVRGDLSLPVTDAALLSISAATVTLFAFNGMQGLFTFSPWNSLPCLALLIVLRSIAQNRLLRSYLQPLYEILNKGAKSVRVVRADGDGQLVLEESLIAHVRTGQVLRLLADEECLVDGVVVSGFAECLERVNGAPAIICAKAPGERISSGAILSNGTVDVEVENSFDDSSARIFEDRITDQVQAELQTLESLVAPLNIFSAALFFAACGLGIWWQKQGVSLDQILQIATAVFALNFFAWFWGYSCLTRAFFPYRAYQIGAMTLNARVLDLLTSIRTLCFDFTARVPFSDGEIVELQTLDTRVDAQALWRALFQLISASPEPWKQALCVKLLEQRVEGSDDSKPKMLRMEGWRTYRGMGMHAILDGAEFSFGNEEFLVARGVSIDPSEVRHAAADELVWYLAVFDELVARVTIDNLGASHQSSVLQQLRSLGLGLRIVSEERSQVVDRYVGRIGVELAYAHSEVDPSVYAQHLQDWSPAAVVMTQIPLAHHCSASCQMVVFDTLRWNLADNHVTLFSKDPAVIFKLLRLAYSEAKRVANIRAICLVFGAVLACLIAAAGCNVFFVMLTATALVWLTNLRA